MKEESVYGREGLHSHRDGLLSGMPQLQLRAHGSTHEVLLVLAHRPHDFVSKHVKKLEKLHNEGIKRKPMPTVKDFL